MAMRKYWENCKKCSDCCPAHVALKCPKKRGVVEVKVRDVEGEEVLVTLIDGEYQFAEYVASGLPYIKAGIEYLTRMALQALQSQKETKHAYQV